MIVDFLIGVFVGLADWLTSPLPTVEVPWLENLTLAISKLDDLNYFLPIAETFSVVVGIIFVFPIFMGVSFLVWFVALIRGGSARG